MKALALYLLAVNVLSFLSFGLDKQKAVHGRRRIRNRTLLGLALLGGSVGALLGMGLFRHKTRQKPYTLGIPLLLLAQLSLLCLLIG